MSGKLKYSRKYKMINPDIYERMKGQPSTPAFDPLESHESREVKRAHSAMGKALSDPHKDIYTQLAEYGRMHEEYKKYLEKLDNPTKQILAKMGALNQQVAQTPFHSPQSTRASTLKQPEVGAFVTPRKLVQKKLKLSNTPRKGATMFDTIRNITQKNRVRTLVDSMRKKGIEVSDTGDIKAGAFNITSDIGSAVLRDISKAKGSRREADKDTVDELTKILRKEGVHYNRQGGGNRLHIPKSKLSPMGLKRLSKWHKY